MISKGEALSEPRASLSPGFPSRVLVILSTRCAAPPNRRLLLPKGHRCAHPKGRRDDISPDFLLIRNYFYLQAIRFGVLSFPTSQNNATLPLFGGWRLIMIEERTGIITFQGNPLTLLGKGVSVGEAAPDFSVLANDLTPRTLADYKGKVLVISVVPSLDTPVCDMQTRRFNAEAAKLSDNVRILTISCDLPFAQTRWCGAAGVDAVETLSDHRDLSFGTAYGVAIKELRLLSRAVFVICADGVIAYEQLVKEVTHDVDFEAALEAVKACLEK